MFISMSTAGRDERTFWDAKSETEKRTACSFNNCIQFANQRVPNDANYERPGPFRGLSSLALRLVVYLAMAYEAIQEPSL